MKKILSGLSVAGLLLLTGCTANAEMSQAEAAVRGFYGKWTVSSDASVNDRYGNDDTLSAEFRARLNDVGNDNARVLAVLCSRDFPATVNVEHAAAVSGNNSAMVTVNARFADKTVPIQVFLKKKPNDNRAWQIDTVNCPELNGSSSSSISTSMSSTPSSMSASMSASRMSSSASSSVHTSSSMNSSAGRTSSSASAMSNSSSRNNAGEGEFCGGIAGIMCASGLTCQYEGTYPDAGGTCVR